MTFGPDAPPHAVRARTPPCRAVLIHNPVAGRGRARILPRLIDILARAGFEAEPQPTSGPGDATARARRAAASGVGAVLAFGGDGTLREAAAGVLGTEVPIGFLPAGTANVMTLPLGLPRDPLRAARALARARVVPLDVGLCGDDPFLMQASCGLDGFLLAGISSRFKRSLGRGAVALSAALAAWRYSYPEIELTVDGVRHRAGFVAVCNIPYYGGRWRLIPQARPDDRRLDLLIFRGRGRAATAGFARDLFLGGRHLGRSDVEVLAVRDRVELTAPGALPLQIDGDGHPVSAPVTVRLAPERLRILSA